MPVTLEPITDDNAERVYHHLLEVGAQRGGDLVDEAELARLSGQRGRKGWSATAALVDGEVRGYAAVVDKEDRVTGDFAGRTGTDVFEPLLAWQREQAAGRDLTVWVRFANEDDIVAMRNAGFDIERQLSVLGRDLDDVEVQPPRGNMHIRAFRIEDLDGLLAVLLEAYDGTPDGGWTRNEITRRRSYPWYRDEDLLVAATPDDRIGGLHWTKRRSGDVGEVYNLAVAPWAQGHGLGRALLTAGMAHVRDWGGEQMILWVDNANRRAMQLYGSMGFTTQWDDLALTPSRD